MGARSFLNYSEIEGLEWPTSLMIQASLKNSSFVMQSLKSTTEVPIKAHHAYSSYYKVPEVI